MKRQVILLGGTFNPVHKGHIELAKNAYETYQIPVMIMPSGDPSSYKSEEVLPASHRVAMLEIAIRDYDYMSISQLEIQRTGRTYTKDTLAQLQDAYDEIYFIIGADSFFALPTWYEPEYICTHCKLLVAGRDRRSFAEMQQQKAFLEETFHASVSFLETKPMPYSSTEIRDLVKAGKDIQTMVPAGVSEYIMDKHLYK